MKPDFDWRSENDLLFDEEVDNRQRRSGRKFSKWWLLSLAFLSVIIVAWVLVRQVKQVVVETASLTENEVVQSLRLLLEAQESGDLELFSSFISGRDSLWAENQLLLMEARLLIDRDQFGLTLLPQTDLEETIVTVSPDLNEAVLEQAFSYRVNGASSDLETVDLRQIFVFRMGQDRWLLSPPKKSFWGSEEREIGRYITVVYPERDQEISQLLAADLEGTVAAACSILSGFCSDKLPITIQFTTNVESLYRNERPNRDLLNGWPIVLPTLSLFGRPTDDVGYRVIYRLFSELVVRDLFDQQARYACCSKPGFHDALSDVQLVQMRIMGLETEFTGSIDLHQISELWQRDADGRVLSLNEIEEISVFINGIVEGLRLKEISEIQQKLGQTEDFWVWFEEVNEQFPLGN